jgi:hypothetical protein
MEELHRSPVFQSELKELTQIVLRETLIQAWAQSRLSLSRCIVLCFSFATEIPEQCHKIGHDRFIPHNFQLIIHVRYTIPRWNAPINYSTQLSVKMSTCRSEKGDKLYLPKHTYSVIYWWTCPLYFLVYCDRFHTTLYITDAAGPVITSHFVELEEKT